MSGQGMGHCSSKAAGVSIGHYPRINNSEFEPLTTLLSGYASDPQVQWWIWHALFPNLLLKTIIRSVCLFADVWAMLHLICHKFKVKCYNIHNLCYNGSLYCQFMKSIQRDFNDRQSSLWPFHTLMSEV